MWCPQCQQDVPGAFSAEVGEFLCPRCAGQFSSGKKAQAVSEETGKDEGSAQVELADLNAPASPPVIDCWELGEQLKHVERVLAARKADAKPRRRTRTRVDQAHGPGRAHSRALGGRSSRGPDRAAPSLLQSLIWPLMGLGLMTFVCGGVLIGWSLAADRAELWTIGLPIALVGQVGLLTGLVLQLERMWSDHRTAVTKLDHVDEELHDLKTATTLLGTTHSSAGSSFYAHLAGGASPQLLLTDLKSQLDLLAVKLGESDDR